MCRCVFECVTVRQSAMDAGLSQGVNAGSWGHNSPVHTACPDRGRWPSSHLAAIYGRTQERVQRGSGGWRDGDKVSLRRRIGRWMRRLPEGWGISLIGVDKGNQSHYWLVNQMLLHGPNKCRNSSVPKVKKHPRFATPRTEIIIHGESPVYPTLVGVYQKHSGLVLSKCINLMNHLILFCHILKLSIIRLCLHGRAANTTARFQARSIVHQDVWTLMKYYPGDFLILNTAQMDFLKEELILSCIYLIQNIETTVIT